MDNHQIKKNVGEIFDVFLEHTEMKIDEDLVLNCRNIFVNVLQNLNDIAWALRKIEERGRPQ